MPLASSVTSSWTRCGSGVLDEGTRSFLPALSRSGHDRAVSTVRFLGRTLKVWSVRRTELAPRLVMVTLGRLSGSPLSEQSFSRVPVSYPNQEAGQLGSTLTLIDGSGLSSVCACVVCVCVYTYVTCMRAQHTSTCMCAHMYTQLNKPFVCVA